MYMCVYAHTVYGIVTATESAIFDQQLLSAWQPVFCSFRCSWQADPSIGVLMDSPFVQGYVSGLLHHVLLTGERK